MNTFLTILALAVFGTAVVGLCAFVLSGRFSRMEEDWEKKQQCDKRHKTWRDS